LNSPPEPKKQPIPYMVFGEVFYKKEKLSGIAFRIFALENLVSISNFGRLKYR